MRDKFIIPEDGPYFLTHSVGPLTKLGKQYLDELYLTPWQAKGGEAWNDWLGLIERFCGSLAALLGGNANEYCPQQNLSAGLNKYLQSLRRQSKKHKVLMHGHAFPSMGFVVTALETAGHELVLIPSQLPAHDPNVWSEYLTEDVSAALITHVHSNTGVLSPVAEIAKIARSKGIRALVDVAQSAGVIPIDIPGWNVDAVFGSCVKWLCGGPGAGWMWVSPHDLDNLTPLDAGWFSHENPFEFDIENFRFVQTAKKFWGGTPNVAPYALALGGIETVLSIGIESIRARNLELMNTALPGHDFAANGGTICYDAGDRAADIERHLKAKNAFYDRRENVFRLSLHISNSLEDAQMLRDSFQRS